MTDRYITNRDYRRQKTALTRAVNSGDPLKVLTAVERTLGEWHDKAWPDDWHRWRVALDDAFHAFHTAEIYLSCPPEYDRFIAARRVLA